MGAWDSPGAFPLVEIHEIPLSPVLQPVEIPLSGSATFTVLALSLFCNVCEVAEGSLCPVVQVINEEVKQYWTQYQSLEYTTSYLPPTGLHATYLNLLDPAIKTVFNLHHCLFILPVICHPVYKDVIGDRVNGFTKINVKKTHCLPVVHQVNHLIVEHWLSLTSPL